MQKKKVCEKYMPIHTLSDIITQIALEQCEFEYPSCFLIPNPDFISFGAKRLIILLNCELKCFFIKDRLIPNKDKLRGEKKTNLKCQKKFRKTKSNSSRAKQSSGLIILSINYWRQLNSIIEKISHNYNWLHRV